MPTETRLSVAAETRFRRARGFHLYDAQGRRWLDLARAGAFLGHRPAGVLTAMKAALSQGLAGDVPSFWETRLVAHLSRMFPSHPVVRLYSSPERALRAAAVSGAVMDPALDPPWPDATGPHAALWRPLLPAVTEATVLLPLLPFASAGAPAPACFRPQAADAGPSDVLPGYLCAGALRALGALGAADLGGRFAPASRKLAAALEGGAWERRGPYVRALFPPDLYARVHAEFFRAGVLLWPTYPGPSLLPGECSPGEAHLLADLFASIPGG